MKVGVVRETKTNEYRVGLLPVGVQLLVQDGHELWVETGAGSGAGFSDADYERAGARIASRAREVFDGVELLVKVKEPQPAEIEQLGPHHTVFGYFHFSGSRSLTQRCLERGFTALAYETLEDEGRGLPLLMPMSEIAGRLSIQAGAKHLEQPQGGRGTLLAGVPGVPPANVVIVGGGVVGSNAARIAAGAGANVQVLDVDLATLRRLESTLPANVSTLYCDPHSLAGALCLADLVVGAVLLRGRAAPKLIQRQHLETMKRGSVLVDVSIDQGGCSETARPTTHSAPTYVERGVVHYCVANMPAAVGYTSTRALCNATLPYVRRLARLGPSAFLAIDEGYGKASNLQSGRITNADVAATFPDLPHGL